MKSRISSNPRTATNIVVGLCVLLLVIAGGIYWNAHMRANESRTEFVKRLQNLDQRPFKAVKHH